MCIDISVCLVMTVAVQAQRDTYLMYGSVITRTSGLSKLIWANMVLILHVCERESDIGGDRV